MIFSSGRILGVAVREQSMLLAEVQCSGGRCEIHRTGEFLFPPNVSLANPQPLGSALRQFLKQKSFAANLAILGVPARLLMAREKEIPPATSAMAASILRLQAERDFPADLKEMIFDYAGEADAKSRRKVLVVAMLREQLDRLTQVAQAAGLSLAAVTSSSLALARADLTPGRAQLLLSPGAAELAACGQAIGQLLRHFPLPSVPSGENTAAVVNALGGEMQRLGCVVRDPASAPLEVLLWDGCAISSQAAATLSARTGTTIKIARDLSSIAESLTASVQFAPAVALAMSAERKPPVNFLRPRLAAPRVRRVGRKAAWAIALAVAVVVGIASLVHDVQSRSSQLAQIDANLARIEPDLVDAKALTARINSARGWYESRTPVLACLRELTGAIPSDGQIWATSLSFRDNGKGILNGKAVDQRSVLTTLDRIKNNPNFADVKLMDMRDAGGNTRDVAFSLNFTFTGVE